MTNDEIDKIISEFMFPDFKKREKIRQVIDDWDYWKSLDDLVPVWEKLKAKGIYLNKIGNRSYNHFSLFLDKKGVRGLDYSTTRPFNFYESLDAETIQQAAAHATALAIKELGAV